MSPFHTKSHHGTLPQAELKKAEAAVDLHAAESRRQRRGLTSSKRQRKTESNSPGSTRCSLPKSRISGSSWRPKSSAVQEPNPNFDHEPRTKSAHWSRTCDGREANARFSSGGWERAWPFEQAAVTAEAANQGVKENPPSVSPTQPSQRQTGQNGKRAPALDAGMVNAKRWWITKSSTKHGGTDGTMLSAARPSVCMATTTTAQLRHSSDGLELADVAWPGHGPKGFTHLTRWSSLSNDGRLWPLRGGALISETRSLVSVVLPACCRDVAQV